MAFPRISAKNPPNIDPTRVPLAYGRRVIPRLKRELHSQNILVRRKAVMALCDYIHDCDHIAEAIRFGIADSLKELLSDSDTTVRHKAVECFCVMAGHAIGRDAFLRLEAIYPLARLFDDTKEIARKNTHMCLLKIAETFVGAESIVNAQFVETLVKKLQTELDEIKEIILDTLHYCMFINTQFALEAGAMEVFTTLLKHDHAVIRFKAARDIMDLSVTQAGKERAVACGAIQLLKFFLSDPSIEVRAKAAGAIMMIAITTKGKYAAIHARTIPSLVALVDDINSEVRLNAIKALTCLAEAPEGRSEMYQSVEKIRRHERDHAAVVAQAAKIAIKFPAALCNAQYLVDGHVMDQADILNARMEVGRIQDSEDAIESATLTRLQELQIKRGVASH